MSIKEYTHNDADKIHMLVKTVFSYNNALARTENFEKVIYDSETRGWYLETSTEKPIAFLLYSDDDYREKYRSIWRDRKSTRLNSSHRNL
jgi:hypothetical protein